MPMCLKLISPAVVIHPFMWIVPPYENEFCMSAAGRRAVVLSFPAKIIALLEVAAEFFTLRLSCTTLPNCFADALTRVPVVAVTLTLGVLVARDKSKSVVAVLQSSAVVSLYRVIHPLSWIFNASSCPFVCFD